MSPDKSVNSGCLNVCIDDIERLGGGMEEKLEQLQLEELDIKTAILNAMELEIDRNWTHQKKQRQTSLGKLKKMLPNRYQPLPIDELNRYRN